MRGDTAILRYAHQGWRFEYVSADARLFWTDLALHLNATGTPSLAVEQANDLDTLFERHRTTQPFVEELVQQHLLIRSMDGCLVCPYLLQMEEKRQGGFHPHARRPASRARKRAAQRGEAYIDRRSVTSRLNGRKGGRPRKSKSVSGQGHLIYSLKGGKDENLNNLNNLKNAQLGSLGYVQSQQLAENSGKLGFESEKVGFSLTGKGREYNINNINKNNPSPSPEEGKDAKPKKPKFALHKIRDVDQGEIARVTQKAARLAGLRDDAGFLAKQTAVIRISLEGGLEESDILEAIKARMEELKKKGQTASHMGCFVKNFTTMYTLKDLNAIEAQKKQQQALEQQKRYNMPAYREAMARYKEETRKWSDAFDHNRVWSKPPSRPDLEQFRQMQVA